MVEKKKNNKLIVILLIIACLIIISGLYLLIHPFEKYIACTEDKQLCISEYEIENDLNYIVKYTVVNKKRSKINSGILKAYNISDEDYRELPFEELEPKAKYNGSIVTDEVSWDGFEQIQKIILVK